MRIFKNRQDHIGELRVFIVCFDFSVGIQFVDTITVGSYPDFVIVVFQDSEATLVANILVGVERVEADVFEYLVFEWNHQYPFLVEGYPDIVLLVFKNTVDFCLSHIEIDQFRFIGRDRFVAEIITFQSVAGQFNQAVTLNRERHVMGEIAQIHSGCGPDRMVVGIFFENLYRRIGDGGSGTKRAVAEFGCILSAIDKRPFRIPFGIEGQVAYVGYTFREGKVGNAGTVECSLFDFGSTLGQLLNGYTCAEFKSPGPYTG